MDATMKTVAVTGASSGFGEGAAKAFSDRGYRVWGTMRDAKGRNAQKKAALEGHSDLITIIDMDVSDDTSVADGFARILAEGPVDILINNAGIMFLGITEAFSVAQAYLSLAEMPAGARPARKTVGLTWGVDEINSRTQSIQDDILNVMHLETVLGGTSA